ncbi:DinB family protein [Aquimarina sp. 2201CG5-10]|uniref:DinB family protein n=1 Tax=Aquimarina callyspongiae TaxID=3098150 RepID=UPI002AB3830C|nr:DinB family protein [Aquimarina sp. 2201CG5-10]MDY8136069.1 DinB family protein [Aquimarina sp. 2201CG5-10]
MLLVSLLCIQCNYNNTELSINERDFAITQLDRSKDSLLSTIDGLSDTQLEFKSDEASWSIAECVEHVTIFVDEVFEILEESLALPANPERRKDVKFSDEELIAFVQDRTNKTKTQEDFEPNKIYGDNDQTINIYLDKLKKHIDYLQNTKDDLRNHYVNFGTVDAYQIFLYMAAHTNRHIAQIKEIKNNVHFPKN